MTELPDISWDRDYRKPTRECVDGAAEAAGEPTPQVWPISGSDARSLRLGRPCYTARLIPTVETKEEEA
jgi:hypothetical protein